MTNFLTRPRFQDRDIKQISGDTITLSGETNVSGVFRVIPNATPGYVLTALDSLGTVYWQPSSGGGSFTGNTSGDCITDLWVTNIHGCSPITIWDSIQSLGSVSSGVPSLTFGVSNYATNLASIAFGGFNLSSGDASFAEGAYNEATGDTSHAEGFFTKAHGIGSHAEGGYTLASGDYSHAGGFGVNSGITVVASGNYSFAHYRNSGKGLGVIAESGAILGGRNHTIQIDANFSAILGGDGGFIDEKSVACAILGGVGNQILDNITGSIVRGGANISATTSNTVYVPNLVIKRELLSVPTTSGDTVGEVGSVVWDDDYFYMKTNTGWGRIPLDYGF